MLSPTQTDSETAKKALDGLESPKNEMESATSLQTEENDATSVKKCHEPFFQHEIQRTSYSGSNIIVPC